MEEDLAAQYVDSGVDFISGGGLHFWTSRSDGRNLVEEMKAKGYTFVDKLEDISTATGDKFLGLYDTRYYRYWYPQESAEAETHRQASASRQSSRQVIMILLFIVRLLSGSLIRPLFLFR